MKTTDKAIFVQAQETIKKSIRHDVAALRIIANLNHGHFGHKSPLYPEQGKWCGESNYFPKEDVNGQWDVMVTEYHNIDDKDFQVTFKLTVDDLVL
jgi:hypothetical protein